MTRSARRPVGPAGAELAPWQAAMSRFFNDGSAPVTARRVTREINLIARNLACRRATSAAAETADHVRLYWAPQLRVVLLEEARHHPERFSAIASDAIAMLGS